MSSKKQRETFVRVAPFVIFFAIGYILYAKLVAMMQVEWPEIFLAVLAALITGFGIVLQYLYGNKYQVLALYATAPVSVYLLYTAYVSDIEMAYILLLASSALGWYIPQLIFRHRILTKLNGEN